jgi:hypothetical protein
MKIQRILSTQSQYSHSIRITIISNPREIYTKELRVNFRACAPFLRIFFEKILFISAMLKELLSPLCLSQN